MDEKVLYESIDSIYSELPEEWQEPFVLLIKTIYHGRHSNPLWATVVLWLRHKNALRSSR